MVQTDLEALLDMGFEKERAEIAVKKSGGLQGALQWLEDNQEKSLDEIKSAQAAVEVEDGDDEDEIKANIAAIEAGGAAKSLVCNECGKKFRNADLATFHATKSGHTDFSESTEEIPTLNAEQTKEKLQMLQERLKDKKAAQVLAEREEAKKNEKIRQKSTREVQDLKEELQRKEQIKIAAKKRQEKLEDMEDRKRIKARIEADRAERRRKDEDAKAIREGRALPELAGPAAAPAAAAPKKPVAERNEARLRLQTDSGNIMKTLPADTTLFEVAQMLQEETGVEISSFTVNFPKKTFQGPIDLAKTLKEAGFVPSAAVICK